MRFKPGDQVVCTKKGEWSSETYIGIVFFGPKFNDVVTATGETDEFGSIRIKEHLFCPDGRCAFWHQRFFEPLITDS